VKLKRIFPVLLALLIAPSIIFAFTPESRANITLQAFKLMPPSLRQQLNKHRKECLRGALDAMSGVGESQHSITENGKFLAEKISEQIDKIVSMIDRQEPFKNIVYEMGILSHYATDLNAPLSPNGDGKEHYNAFYRFCFQKEKKIRIVFYGFSDPFLAQKDLAQFSENSLNRTLSHVPYVKDSFSRARNGSDSEFDERSILFGIAALSYSHAVTDIARLWLYAWNESHGDLTGTPFPETLKKRDKK